MNNQIDDKNEPTEEIKNNKYCSFECCRNRFTISRFLGFISS